MTPLRNNNVGGPIRDFVFVPSSDLLDSMNALVFDLNRYFAQFVSGIAQISSTYANLPSTAPEGAEIWVSDGKKIGEVSIGTGIWAVYSHGAWRTISTDAPLGVGGGAILAEDGTAILQESGGKILA